MYLPFLQLRVAGFQIYTFLHLILFWIFTLTPTLVVIQFLIQVTYSTIKLTFTFA